MKNNPEKKTFFSDLFFGIVFLIAVNLIVWLAWFIISLLGAAVINELLGRADAAGKQMITDIQNVICTLLYAVVFVTVNKYNPVERTAYLSRAYEEKQPLYKEVLSYVITRLPVSVLSYAVFILPLFIGISLDPNVAVLPSLYLAQHAFYQLIGNVWGAYGLSALFYCLISLISIPVIQRFWYKNRIRQ